MYRTNAQRGDGFGATFFNIIFDILYTEHHGDIFVYTPIRSIEHNYANNPNHTAELENFMNIKGSYMSLDETGGIKPIENHDVRNVYAFVESRINEMVKSDSMSKVRESFMKDKVSPFNNENMNVSIHIRRPNSRDVATYGTDTPNSYYLHIINMIRTMDNKKPVIFHIYSQGDEKMFSDLIGDDTILHLNESIQDTFLGLVFGDILVMSMSAFSYTAAILTKGKVYYKHMCVSPLAEWIVG